MTFKRLICMDTRYKCSICNEGYGRLSQSADGTKWCRLCSTFASNLYNNYGITFAVYNALLEKQNHRCAICNALDTSSRLPGPKYKHGLVVDHCHTSKQVRGLLCHSCNTMLGACKDNPVTLQSGIDYLSHQG